MFNIFGLIILSLLLVVGGVFLVRWIYRRQIQKEAEYVRENDQFVDSVGDAHPAPRIKINDGEPKWVAFEKEFRMGYVQFHNDFRGKNEPKPFGGGWFDVDHDLKIIYLYKLSTDFGQCTEEEVVRAIHNTPLPQLADYKVMFSTSYWWAEAMEDSKYLGKIDSDGCGFAVHE